MSKLPDRAAPAQMAPTGIDADQEAQRAQQAVTARFDVPGRDAALDALGDALEAFRRTRAEFRECPCGEGKNPLHAFLNHGGRR